MNAPSMLGRQIGDWKIVSELGEGGMGLVFKGQHVKHGQLVAIKSLHQSLMNNQAARDRFVREAQALARLNHPNIISLLNFINDEGGCFIVMELADGEDLEHKLQRMGNMPPDQCISWFAQACKALAYAHKQGIIHRDIKPSNLIVHPDGTTKLLDFGTAKLVDAKRLTQQGMTLGTVIYMSKEQLLGKPLDARSDVYSLGVTLYECVTGQLPFYDEEERKLVVKIAKTDPIPPSQHLPGLSKELEQIILKSMAKEPENRFQSADDMAAALLALDLRPSAAPAPAPPAPSTPVQVPTPAPVAPAPAAPGGGGSALFSPLVLTGVACLIVGLLGGGILALAGTGALRWVGVGVLAVFGLIGAGLCIIGLLSGGSARPIAAPATKCPTCGRVLAFTGPCSVCNAPPPIPAPFDAVGTLNVNSANAAQNMGPAAVTLAAPAASGQASLKVTDGADKGKVFPVRQAAPCVLGRAPDCVGVLSDAGVSGHHAQVRFDGAILVVEDMGSRNGVYVNNQKTPRQTLKTGDLIVIGSTRLLVTLG